MGAKQKALVIGVSKYPDPQDHLPAVAKDVREMAKILASRNGVFTATTVKTLIDRKVTRSATLLELKSIFSESLDTIFVYLAGHGYESGGKYYFVAYDTVGDETAVPLAEVKKLFEGSRSKSVFLWLDFCHSGGILARGSKDLAVIRREIGVISGSGKVIVAACTAAQQSYESSTIGHGFFTHALLSGLRGAAKSAQGEVTAHSLYEYIDHQITNPNQQPVFSGETTGRIVLMNFGNRSGTESTKLTKSKKLVRPSSLGKSPKGTWFMLGEQFYSAAKIAERSNGIVEIELLSNSGEANAALTELRPTQYRRPGRLAFAVHNDAFEVDVEEASSEYVGTRQRWTIKLKKQPYQSSGFTDMQVNGLSADEIAKRRAGRILLNDPAPSLSRGYNGDHILEMAISGTGANGRSVDCVVREMFQRYGRSKWWVDAARLKAVYLLKSTGTVEHIIELKLGTPRNNKVAVTLHGRRRKAYSNQEPASIRLLGHCSLN